jgi:NADPH:quinone reductase-like Zn-dependent oxidoreductase
VALGEDAPAHLAVGDRVAGMVHGMNKLGPDVGAFAEYVGACSDLLLKLPDSMSIEEGASLGTGVGTALLSLFYELKVPVCMDQMAKGDIPSGDGGEFVLVAGGATASGTRAIQLLKRYVHQAFCSSLNFHCFSLVPSAIILLSVPAAVH